MKEIKRMSAPLVIRTSEVLEGAQMAEIITIPARDVQIQHINPENLKEILESLKGSEVIPGILDHRTSEISTFSCRNFSL